MQLNEGLRVLGVRETIYSTEYEGRVFSESAVERVRIPSTLKKVEAKMFKDCKYLRSVEVSDGVESIGRKCFQSSAIEQIALPSTLKEIGKGAFAGCSCLRTVLVGEGCTLNIRKYVGSNVEVRCE